MRSEKSMKKSYAEARTKLLNHLGVNRLWEIHHIDGNCFNNKLDNLTHLTKSQHKFIHSNRIIISSQDVDEETKLIKTIPMTYIEKAIMTNKYTRIKKDGFRMPVLKCSTSLGERT